LVGIQGRNQKAETAGYDSEASLRKSMTSSDVDAVTECQCNEGSSPKYIVPNRKDMMAATILVTSVPTGRVPGGNGRRRRHFDWITCL